MVKKLIIINIKSFVLIIALLIFSISSFCVATVSAATTDSATNPVSKVLLGCTTGVVPCGFVELISLVNAMVQYGIELIGIAFVIALLYAGFLYLTSGGDPSKVKKVRDVLWKIVWGMAYTLCGWVIVYFILKSLGVGPDFYEGILSI